jgi:hypothetical protein
VTPAKLPKSWPPIARDILVGAARRYNHAINEPWAVPDVELRQVIDEAKEEFGRRQDEIYEEASTRWINRWEHDQLDEEMERAIRETSRRMSRAERVIRPRAGARKKSPRQLDAEIAQAISGRGAAPSKASRRHATVRGRPRITEEQARAMPRFDFIAHWLTIITKKKENRGPLGLYVKRVGKRWQIVSPVGGGTVTYETADPALLFDYARRGQLGSHIRDAEEFRGLAYQRAGVR